MISILEHLKCCKSIADEHGTSFDPVAFEGVCRLPGQSSIESNIRFYQFGSLVIVRRYDYEVNGECRVIFHLEPMDNKWSFDVYTFENEHTECIADYDIPLYSTEEEFFQMSLMKNVHNNTFEELQEAEVIVREFLSIYKHYGDNITYGERP